MNMESKTTVTLLAALAQETRLAIFRTLVQTGPSGLSVGEIAAGVKAAPATLSFHLKELTHAGLISARQESRFIFYSANYPAINELIAFLTENCCARDGVACVGTKCSPAAASDPGKSSSTPRARAGSAKRGKLTS